MTSSASFTIYNASAGSGKTFTLTKLYLTKLLTDSRPGAFKNLLALTFTNKAVAEMKSRIVSTLVAFAHQDSIGDPPVMLSMIANETQTEIQLLHQRAQKILKHLLHNYAQFSIETIDHFNHRLIRTFARDLKLPPHFEVSLDAPQLISEAIDNLISKAGQDKQITEVLVEFTLQKTDDDKSWDISYDIFNTASLLLNETDAAHLAQYKNLSLQDFKTIRNALNENRASLLSSLQDISIKTLETVEEAGLERTDFNGGSRAYFPSYLEKLSEGNLGVTFGAAWQETMGEKPMYPKTKTTDFIAETIDTLTPQFIAVFNKTKELVAKIWLYDNMLSNIVPLSVINLVQQELDLVKEDQNILPISEFNALIHEQIKDQPAPFIYERLGDRYRHFFIDEFQDTSLLQWKNLIPLINNALSQQFEDSTSGSLLLVGDAKQAIYRWRGGLPEQFISLYGGHTPFSAAENDIKTLDTNWRSAETIIQFNNELFRFIASSFGNDMHRELYEIGTLQKTNPKPEGYVEIQFIAPENKTEAHELYGAATLETIQKLQEQGYGLDDICILTRTKKNGIALSTYLMQHAIKVLSSETLLLQSSPLVQCLIDVLQFSLFPENRQAKVSFLEFIHDHFKISMAKHDFLANLNTIEGMRFTAALASHEIVFSTEEINSLSLYQACEYVINQLALNRTADAYLFSFMDLVLDFENQPQAGKLNFLEFWDRKKETASISTATTKNAVTLMTIHKSKGLEFPIVLFPYADTDIYHEMNAKAWYGIDNPLIDEMLINFKSEVEYYGEQGSMIYEARRNTLELDNFNLLYVTLTRAISQLYIYSEVPKKRSLERPKNFQSALISFLSHKGLWEEQQVRYQFGNFAETCRLRDTQISDDESFLEVSPSYLSSTPERHNVTVAGSEASLWETPSGSAIHFGNLLHDTLEKIRTTKDMDTVFSIYEKTATLSDTERVQLQEIIGNIVTHPEVRHLFDESLDDASIFNERDIVTSMNELIRPDRINFLGDRQVSLVDYKTGELNRKHELQIQNYALALEEMGFRVVEKILIYAQGSDILINKI